MSWLYYLLEANLYFVIFYGFYRLFLYHDTFYGLNRSYLIFGSILAFLLPFFQLGFLKAPVIEQITAASTTETVVSQVVMTENMPLETYQPSIFTIDNAIIAIYSLVTIAFLFKMLFNLSKIISMRKLPSVKLDNGVKLIDLKDSKIAFSFFNLLFLDPQLAEKNTILKHELVHIKQKHSLDVLLFEIIQIINWFNPIVYLVKKDIKLIHEYLADEETTKCDVEKYHYAMFLIQNSTGIQNLTLTNQIFNSSILKKRISMLNQKKSARWARLKLLVVLPITAGILCISTMAFTKDYGFVDLLPEKASVQLPPQQEKPNIGVKRIPPPPAISKTYFPPYKRDGKNNYVSLEKRLIVINGKEIADKNKFYGAADATEINFLKTAEATEKYGKTKGQFGAIEIIGKNIVFTLQPPILKKDRIKFPPPIAVPDNQTFFYPKNEYSIKNQKAAIIDQRYIVINGKPVTDNSTFYGVINTNSIKYLNQSAATKKYGQEKGKNGAVEITGENIKYLTKVSPPPLPLEKDKTENRKIKALTTKGDKDALETKTVQGYLIENNEKKKLQEVTVKAYKDALASRTVQGYPIQTKEVATSIKATPQFNKNLKEVYIKAYDKASEVKSDSEVKEIKTKENNLTTTGQQNKAIAVETIYQDNLDKSKNEKLLVNIPEGATAELTVLNTSLNKAIFRTSDYQNNWNAKDVPSGNYSYTFLFRKEGKLVGGKNGYVRIK
ncbi:M56 family metallopeptidase [Pedobacter sp. HDW13]|nr:M56 family metallopeptidase [Pedobacter sp. HDW13]